MAAETVITQMKKEEEVTTINTTAKTYKKSKAPNFVRKLLCCLRPRTNHQSIQDIQPSSLAQTTLLNNLTIDEIIVDKGKDSGLLQTVEDEYTNKKCLVIDLDETLVHSSFVPVQNADFTIPVEIDGTIHQVYVLKRPYVDEFLQHVGKLFECVLFTASLGKYADPVTDLLDKWGSFKHRLFRESCVFHKGSYVKDLSRLGREVDNTVILDNSPASYMFHPTHAVPILSWFDDQADTCLLELMAFFDKMASSSSDAATFLRDNNVQGDVMFEHSGVDLQATDSTESLSHTVQHHNTIITSVTSPTS